MVYGVQELLYLWDSYGIFDVVLPFLLIFAVVFGILNYIGIFGDNKGIHVIIAVVIGLLAVRSSYGFFNEFYKEVFPRLGVGISIILVVMILVGLFIADDVKKYWFWGLSAIGAIISLYIVLQSFSNLGWSYSYYFGSDSLGWILGAVLIIGLIIAVASSSSNSDSSSKTKGRKAVEDIVGKLWGK